MPGRWAPAVGLFVVAHKIDMDHWQAPGDVNLCADGHQFAQQNADGHPGGHKFQFFQQIAAADEAYGAVI